MTKQINTWTLLLNSIQQAIPCMLMYVLESIGSSPGRQGFFMMVNASGAMSGSLGGGMMEHKMVELAKARLANHELIAEFIPQYHQKNAPTNQSGMICSGEQWIWMQSITKADETWIQNLLIDLKLDNKGTLIITNDGCNYVQETNPVPYSFAKNENNHFEYKEQTGFKNELHIVGGGHCSLALSKLMCEMDYHITVYETRSTLNTFLDNNYAHKKVTIEDFNELEHLIQPGNNVYVVIMTFGYRTDDIALQSIINHSYKYVGVLGSKNKMETLMNSYRKDNIEEAKLSRVRTPIGININSKTPEEIAISIAAEIIAVKNEAVI